MAGPVSDMISFWMGQFLLWQFYTGSVFGSVSFWPAQFFFILAGFWLKKEVYFGSVFCMSQSFSRSVTFVTFGKPRVWLGQFLTGSVFEWGNFWLEQFLIEAVFYLVSSWLGQFLIWAVFWHGQFLAETVWVIQYDSYFISNII